MLKPYNAFWINPKSRHVYEVLSQMNIHNCATGIFSEKSKVQNLRTGTCRIFTTKDFWGLERLSKQDSLEIYTKKYCHAQSSPKSKETSKVAREIMNGEGGFRGYHLGY